MEGIAEETRNPDATQSVYVEAVGDFLKAGEIADPKVRITRILRVDLEGDGEEEVLISATNYFSEDKSDHSAAPFPEAPIESPRRGSYFVVILRRIVAGKVQTQLVAGEVYPKPDEPVAPNVHQVTAVLDLNGDGKLEVIVHSFYYEGGRPPSTAATSIRSRPYFLSNAEFERHKFDVPKHARSFIKMPWSCSGHSRDILATTSFGHCSGRSCRMRSPGGTCLC